MDSISQSSGHLTIRKEKIKEFLRDYFFHVIDSLGIVIANLLFGVVNLIVELSVRFVRNPIKSLIILFLVFAIISASLKMNELAHIIPKK